MDFYSLPEKYPINKLYIPAGWLVSKNELIDKDVSFLNNAASDRYTQSVLEQIFFTPSDIFRASSEHKMIDIETGHQRTVRGFIYIYCGYYSNRETVSADELVHYTDLSYFIHLGITVIKKRNTDLAFEKDEEFDHRYDVINYANKLMNFFSYTAVDLLREKGMSIDLSKYFEN